MADNSNWDKFFENYVRPEPPELRNVLMEATLRVAVAMRLMQLKQLPSDRRPQLDDWVQCEICHGSGVDLAARKKGESVICHLCNGACSMPRQEYLSAIIGAFGDDLQFGGKHCNVAFKTMVEAIALMCLYNPSDVVFHGITFPSVV